MRSTKVTADEQPRMRRTFSLRGLMRTTSLVCMLSAVPGFWPAVIVLSTALLALLLPGLAVLAGLIALQLPAYLAWKRVTWRRVIAAKTRHAPIEENFFRVRTISR